jgi:hypothetical protein
VGVVLGAAGKSGERPSRSLTKVVGSGRWKMIAFVRMRFAQANCTHGRMKR